MGIDRISPTDPLQSSPLSTATEKTLSLALEFDVLLTSIVNTSTLLVRTAEKNDDKEKTVREMENRAVSNRAVQEITKTIQKGHSNSTEGYDLD